mmetsp:Transcript_32973/g.51546  ORF Transcript_32973/g.51546 Transcript_32973/m.51546 type:complete len:254 (-) Transcript_32973:222-983(-)
MLQIFPVRAFADNYIWVLLNSLKRQAIVVDPGQADPVHNIFSRMGIELAGIFVTHHHHDHTGGIAALTRGIDIPVYGSAASKVREVTHRVCDEDKIHVEALDVTFDVLAIPGHTLDHVAYYTHNAVFCGDTLFLGGCGRIFEGTPSQMYQSLRKLQALPQDTMVYCGHDYTLRNLSFAKLVDPENTELARRYEKVRKLEGEAMPALLYEEVATNPFLRCESPSIRTAVEAWSQTKLRGGLDVFSRLREWKDAT